MDKAAAVTSSGYEPKASLFLGSGLRTVANRGGAGRKKQGLEDLVRTSERTVRRRQAQGCWTTSSTCWRLGARRSRGRHTTAAREPPRHTVEGPRLKGVVLGAISTPQGRRSSLGLQSATSHRRRLCATWTGEDVPTSNRRRQQRTPEGLIFVWDTTQGTHRTSAVVSRVSSEKCRESVWTVLGLHRRRTSTSFCSFACSKF